MELVKNPFFILGAIAQDGRQRILELEEEKALSSDEAVAREAAATLVNPRRRLAAELAWLLGLQANQVAEILSTLATDPKSILNQSDLPPLARANLLADGLKQSATILSLNEIAKWIIELSRVYDSLDVKQTLTLLNQERSEAGFPEIPESSPHIGTELATRRQYFLEAIKKVLDQLNWEDRVLGVTLIASQATNDGLYQAPILIDDLVDKFEVEAQDFLEKESENINVLIEEIHQVARTKKSRVDTDRLITKLEKIVKNWDRVAQPIQVSARSRGFQHAFSYQVSNKIRNLAVELTNEYGLIDFSQRLVILQQEVFAEVDKIVEQSEQDASALNELEKREKFWEAFQKELTAKQTQRNTSSTDGVLKKIWSWAWSWIRLLVYIAVVWLICGLFLYILFRIIE